MVSLYGYIQIRLPSYTDINFSFLGIKIELKTKCLIQRIVGKYAGIIIKNILRIYFILGMCLSYVGR